MDGESHFLIRHGYELLFLGVLADQLAIPVPTIPLLLAAGALVGAGRLNAVATLAVAIAASLVGDSAFYGLGRRYGRRFLGFLCRVTLQSGRCVDRAERFASRYGAWGLLVQRWLPGLATIVSPVLGVSAMPFARFILLDAVGTTVWTGLLVGLGYAFSDRLGRLATGIEHIGTWTAVCLVVAVAASLAWRYARR
jgi:membrane protein DedA with SNARE-associated domain